MSAVRCIWCGNHDPNPSPEHIFPAALGCPDNFCLTNGEVCTNCNNGLGHLDQAIVDDFDFMAFTSGVPRRGGRPPRIGNRRNVFAEVRDGHPTIHLNAESHEVDIGGRRILSGYRGDGRDIAIEFSGSPEEYGATIHLSFQFGTSRKFTQGLYKIAFSCLAYYSGYEMCLDGRYNEIRNFVLQRRSRGRPPLKRKALMVTTSPGPICFRFMPPIGLEGGIQEVVTFKLGFPEFVVDLSPGQVHLSRLVEECERSFGDRGWGLLPPGSR